MIRSIFGFMLLLMSFPVLLIFWPFGVVLAYVGTQVMVNNNN